MDYNNLGNSGEQPDGGGRRPISLDYLKYKGKIKQIALIAVIIIAIMSISLSTVYQLNSGEQAIITRFGRYVRTEDVPGLQTKLPWIEKSYIVNVEGIRRLEFGYRTSGVSDMVESHPDNPTNSSLNATGDSKDSSVQYETVDQGNESSMLTKDENIVIADWAIQYKVADSRAYLFNVIYPIDTLRIIAESAYRRVVASHDLDDILTDKKDTMQGEVLVDLQALCNQYGLGIVITSVELQDAMPPEQVKAAFLDVTAAQEEKAAMINEATRYENEKLPVARGDAEKKLNDAEGYKQERINEAVGAASRYTSIEEEYAKMPGITKTRMYLEMIHEVLPKVRQVYIMDESSDTLKVIPISGAEDNALLPSVATYGKEGK